MLLKFLLKLSNYFLLNCFLSFNFGRIRNNKIDKKIIYVWWIVLMLGNELFEVWDYLNFFAQNFINNFLVIFFVRILFWSFPILR